VRSFAWLALGLLAGALAFGWWSRDRAVPSVAPPPPAPMEPAPTEPPRVAPAPAQPATLAPTLVPGCSRTEGEPIGPSLADTANERMGELWDRTRYLLNAGEGSEELRAGLRALLTQDTERAFAALRDAPDRVVDGFDIASAAAFAQVIRALGADGDPDAALADLAAVAPEGALHPLAAALVARQREDDAEELAALTTAFARTDDPAVAFALASTATRQGQSALGLEALRAYAAEYPDDEWARGMLPLVAHRAEVESTMVETTRGGVTLRHAPGFGARSARAVHEGILRALHEAAELLGVERRPTLVAILYPDRETLVAVTCGPEWTGGLFDGALRLDGGARPESLAVTVRHESLHAQLAAVAPRAPLWLHEGLAQVFEERTPPALERTLTLMVRERTYVPFASLEGSFVVIDDAQSARFAYHQSYAMVAALLDREGPDTLRRAVAHLRTGGDPTAVLSAMSARPFTGDELLAWVEARDP